MNVSLGAQGQVFRADANLVIVDAMVLHRGVPVLGLQAADFRLLDNGVPQEIEMIPGEGVPLDVSLIVDTGGVNSQSPLRFWADVRAIAALLRPGDRLGLTTFSESVRQQLALRPVPVVIPDAPLSGGGAPPLFDALFQGLIRSGSPGRRRAIVLMTDGVDLMSVLAPATVLDVAKKADASIFCVVRPGRIRTIHPLLGDICGVSGSSLIKESNLLTAFRQILAALQRGYFLAYTPHGVAPAGWHTIDVTVDRPGIYSVSARRGYLGSR
jgi:hypothetical protein